MRFSRFFECFNSSKDFENVFFNQFLNLVRNYLLNIFCLFECYLYFMTPFSYSHLNNIFFIICLANLKTKTEILNTFFYNMFGQFKIKIWNPTRIQLNYFFLENQYFMKNFGAQLRLNIATQILFITYNKTYNIHVDKKRNVPDADLSSSWKQNPNISVYYPLLH